MSDNFREFDLGLQRFSQETVPESVRDFRDAVALEGLKGVVNLSPVDTGRLRANWQTTVGSPATGFDEDRKDKREAEGGNVAVTEGKGVIANATDPYAPIWLANGVPYAVHVDGGTAKVPAVHMVGQTVARLRRQFQRWRGSR